jgi:DNA-binding NtrC family response regulator
MMSRRKPANAWSQLLDAVPRPVYLVDDQRRIVYCNQACREWLELAAQEELSAACTFRAPGLPVHPAELAAGLCPPPEALAGQRLRGTVCRLGPDGALRERQAEMIPLAAGQDAAAPVLVVLDLVDEPTAAADLQTADLAAGELHQVVRRWRAHRAEKFRLDRLIGSSPAVQCARAQADLAAASRVNVLLVGPAGCGREHLAAAIHLARGPAASGPWLPIDVAGLDGELLTASLATAASGGSGSAVLLRQVDRLPPETQLLLQRMLETRALAVPVFSTAGRTLASAAVEGEFLPHLAAALSTLVIELPPLAQRTEDLPLIAQSLIEEINARGGKQVTALTDDALELLAAHRWPGNLDELVEVIETAHERAAGTQITPGDLPRPLQGAVEATARRAPRDEPIVLEAFLKQVETELVQRALRRARGNKSRAARLLGLTRPRLYRRLAQLGLAEDPPA